MDNVFVFVVIFAYFGVPLKYQYRVLFWGIFGAIVMRLTFILVAGELLERFHWVMYIFGAFLLYTGVKLASAHGTETHPENNVVLRFARKHLRVAEGTHGDHFFVRQNGRLYVTSLFLVLLVIESTDVVFAIDSVPAIFGITSDRFIVFTSNVFAIMGLRALYFLLAGVMNLFRYLSYGLSAILIFIGIKMLLHDFIHLPHWASLLIIVALLATSIIASLIAARRDPPDDDDHEDGPPSAPTPLRKSLDPFARPCNNGLGRRPARPARPKNERSFLHVCAQACDWVPCPHRAARWACFHARVATCSRSASPRESMAPEFPVRRPGRLHPG
jgi:tellurite resistance protein TerC